MKLLVGLGNPEKKYDGTYHNMGFFVLDKFAEKFNVDFDKKKHNCKYCHRYYNKQHDCSTVPVFILHKKYHD